MASRSQDVDCHIDIYADMLVYKHMNLSCQHV